MSADSLRADLVTTLVDVSRWLESRDVPAVVIGGVAVSLLARPRFTQDVDLLADVPEGQWDALIACAPEFGIEPRINEPAAFARQSRVLLMRHQSSGVDIDLVFGALSFERELVAAGVRQTIGSLTVRLPRVEDLMVLKAFAHRPRDLEDLSALLAAHPQADVATVRQWVREFSIAAASPDLLDDLDRLLAARKC